MFEFRAAELSQSRHQVLKGLSPLYYLLILYPEMGYWIFSETTTFVTIVSIRNSNCHIYFFSCQSWEFIDLVIIETWRQKICMHSYISNFQLLVFITVKTVIFFFFAKEAVLFMVTRDLYYCCPKFIKLFIHAGWCCHIL